MFSILCRQLRAKHSLWISIFILLGLGRVSIKEQSYYSRDLQANISENEKLHVFQKEYLWVKI